MLPAHRYLPGQYCFIAIPEFNIYRHATEFHPFTISSAPHEPFFTLHIRAAGDWTRKLHAAADTPDKRNNATNNKLSEGEGKNPKRPTYVLFDGPFGSASEEVFDHDIAVMVGAGIGVTPFASILKDVRQKIDVLNRSRLDTDMLQELLQALGRWSGSSRTSLSLKKLYFFWTTRNQGAFHWFGDLLTSLTSVEDPVAAGGGSKGSESDEASSRPWELEIATYITGAKIDENKDLGSLFLQLGLDLVRQTSGVSLLTGHNLGTRFERPNWDTIFSRIADAHKGLKIGVFFCGPARLGATLKEKCEEQNAAANSKANGTRFSFHTEVF